ncbi:MAG TPA: 4'-phosphopantetheinyl transferase superfamily protein [Lysobacter sp.]
MRDAFACVPLRAGACLVAVADLRDWHPWLDDAWALLDAAERERVGQRRFAADREALALTYALHRMFVAAATDRSPGTVHIGRDAEGCPQVRGPVGEAVPLHTSLSHADGVAAFALSACGPVGVDIEASFRASELPGIAPCVCHPSELQSLRGFAEPAYSRALLALWVRKEALLKAEGIGLARAMDSFLAAAGAEYPLTGRTRETPACSVRLAMLDAGERWTAAVATPREAAVECVRLVPLGRSGGAGAL